MKPRIDLHTHTMASGHAYSTLNENIVVAKANGLEILGVSDHTPALPNSTCPAYFANLKVLPKQFDALTLLKGAELNILSAKGDVDLAVELIKGLDYAIASIHLPCYIQVDRDGNTAAVINAMNHDKVVMIGHPDDSRFPLNYEPIVVAAKEKGVLLEINNSSLGPNSFREGAKDNLLEMLALCKRYGVEIMMSSDAHFNTDIGRFDHALALIAEAEFPQELIVNDKVKRFYEILEQCQNKKRL